MPRRLLSIISLGDWTTSGKMIPELGRFMNGGASSYECVAEA